MNLPDKNATSLQANDALRRYWNEDAPTYDIWPEHGALSALERAAWASELSRVLPREGRTLLDIGAGTGFLSMAAARLGYQVTALDISEGMLARLQASAARDGLTIATVHAPADEPPEGPFDAVIERLALWTLPDPGRALRAWRSVTAPGGRLVAFEGIWTGGGYEEALRRRGRMLLHRLRRSPPEHHAPYPAELLDALPLVRDPSPERLLEQIEAAGWESPRLARLRDVEFARVAARSRLEQLLGTTPEYVISADSGKSLEIAGSA
jgi:SAM-dependent methyltransferase